MKKIQLTDTHKEKLFQIPLFRNLPLNIKESLLEKLDFVVYIANKKEIVVTQGTPCNKLYVLLEGKLRTDIIDGLGNEVMIEYIIHAGISFLGNDLALTNTGNRDGKSEPTALILEYCRGGCLDRDTQQQAYCQ